MNSIGAHADLAKAVGNDLVTRAARAPAAVTPLLLDQTGYWFERWTAILEPVVKPAQQCCDPAEPFQELGNTHSFSWPAGVFKWRFSDELLAMPTDFEKNIALARAVELTFERAPGGSAAVADRMIAVLEQAGIPVSGHITEYAMSAHANLLILGCSRRTMAPGANIMLHTGRTAGFWTADGLIMAADSLRRSNEKTASRFAEALGRPLVEVREWFTGGDDYWFNSECALENGLIDKISAG